MRRALQKHSVDREVELARSVALNARGKPSCPGRVTADTAILPECDSGESLDQEAEGRVAEDV